MHLAMEALGAINLRTDQAIYIWRASNGRLLAILSAHVDDLKMGGETATIEWILAELTKWFGELKVQRGSFEQR